MSHLSKISGDRLAPLTMTQYYQYPPLDMDSGQIRLVHLLPGNDEPLRIKLTTCLLMEAAYTALSCESTHLGNYANDDIECEGGIIEIQPTLYLFLQSLRQSGHVEPLWVSDICYPLLERRDDQYVLDKLPLIYHMAQRTLCWAGVGDLPVLQNLTCTTSVVPNYQKSLIELLSEVDILHSTYRIVEHDLEMFGKEVEMFDSNIGHQMISFLNQPYFKEYVQSFFQLSHRLTKHQDMGDTRHRMFPESYHIRQRTERALGRTGTEFARLAVLQSQVRTPIPGDYVCASL